MVEYPQRLLLLDSGCRCDVKLVIEYLMDFLGRSMGDLKLVIVTHAHPDHSGGASYFQKNFKIPVAGAESLNDWYGGAVGFFTYWVDIALTYFVASKRQRSFENIIFPRKIRLDYHLNEGDNVPFFKDWKVILAPGHTLSDLTLWHPESQRAYIADNLVKSKTTFYRPYPLVSPQSYQASLKRYMDLGIRKFLLAHSDEHEVSYERIQYLMDTSPKNPRIHRTNLKGILGHLIKAIFKKKGV